VADNQATSNSLSLSSLSHGWIGSRHNQCVSLTQTSRLAGATVCPHPTRHACSGPSTYKFIYIYIILSACILHAMPYLLERGPITKGNSALSPGTKNITDQNLSSLLLLLLFY
jgi:hypothetical protein